MAEETTQPGMSKYGVDPSLDHGISTIDPAPPPASSKRHLFRQVFRFGVVGALNTVVDLTVLNVLIFTTHRGRTGAMYALYKAIAFACAVLNSYLLNRSWTFQRAGSKSQTVEGAQFLFISVLGSVVNVGSSWYVATFAHPFGKLNQNLWPSIAALIGTGFSLGFNFIGYKFWVFAHRHPHKLSPS